MGNGKRKNFGHHPYFTKGGVRKIHVADDHYKSGVNPSDEDFVRRTYGSRRPKGDKRFGNE